MENQRYTKIVLVGNANSGKTALYKRYVEDIFEDEYIPTMSSDFKIKETIHNHRLIKLQIWDLSGDKSFRSVHSDYKGINAYLVCIDLTETSALDSAIGWVNDIKKIAESSKVPILLVGTKADLEDKRIISDEQLAQKTQQMNCEGYFITSAKDNLQVKQVFERVAELVKPQHENVIYSALKKIQNKNPKHEKLSFWQRHKRKIIAGIIICTCVLAAIALSLVLPATVPFLASIGLVIPFTGYAAMAALAGIGAAVGLVAGSVAAVMTFGIEMIIKRLNRIRKDREDINPKKDDLHPSSYSHGSANNSFTLQDDKVYGSPITAYGHEQGNNHSDSVKQVSHNDQQNEYSNNVVPNLKK